MWTCLYPAIDSALPTGRRKLCLVKVPIQDLMGSRFNRGLKTGFYYTSHHPQTDYFCILLHPTRHCEIINLLPVYLAKAFAQSFGETSHTDSTDILWIGKDGREFIIRTNLRYLALFEATDPRRYPLPLVSSPRRFE